MIVTDRVRLVELLDFYVPGRPQPKGSWRSLPGGHVKADNPDEARWASDTALFARAAMKGKKPFDVACLIRLTFFMPRDFIKLTRKGPVFCERAGPQPDSAPDLDKLTRSVFDALKTGGVLADDGRVVGAELWKFWAEDNPLPREAGKPGLAISIWQAMP